MSEKDTETNSSASKTTAKKAAPKKSAAKNAATKKAAAKKAAPKKTAEKKVEQTIEKTAKTATADTAPYMLNNNATDNSNNRSNFIVPGILVLALGIIIVSTFFDKELATLVTKSEDMVSTVDSAENTDEGITEANNLFATSSVRDTSKSAAELTEYAQQMTPAKSHPMMNQQHRRTQQMMQRQFPQRPSWSLTNAPFNVQPMQSKEHTEMISKQKDVYETAMKRQQEIMQKLQEVRINSYKEYQKQQKELHTKMDELRKQSLKLHQDMTLKMKEIHDKYQTI